MYQMCMKMMKMTVDEVDEDDVDEDDVDEDNVDEDDVEEDEVDKENVDEDDNISGSFHWLMRMCLPVYNTLRFLDLQTYNFLRKRWMASISRLIDHINCADYYLTYDMLPCIEEFDRDRAMFTCETLRVFYYSRRLRTSPKGCQSLISNFLLVLRPLN